MTVPTGSASVRGKEVSGLSGSGGQYTFLQLYQGVEITRSLHEVSFTACERERWASYSLQPK